MKVLSILLLCALVVAKSSGRGSSGARSSSSKSSSRSSPSSRSSSSLSSSTKSSSSRSSSSSSRSGLFSFGGLTSKNKGSSNGPSKSGPSRSSSSSISNWFKNQYSRVKTSKIPSSTSSGAKNSRGNSAARKQVASGIFSGTPTIGRGSTASGVTSFSSGSGSSSASSATSQSKFQKIKSKIIEAARRKGPGLAMKAAQKLGPKLIKYVTGRFSGNKNRNRVAAVGGGVHYPSQQYPSLPYQPISTGPGAYSSQNVPRIPLQRHQVPTRNETRFSEIETPTTETDEIFIPFNDNLLAQCPEKVDAFFQFGNFSFIFEDHHMFVIEDGSLNQTLFTSDLFPGVHKVHASVYDANEDIVLLINERTIFGFHWNETLDEFRAISGFPRSLPSSISFQPTAAFTWVDGYPVLVSDQGQFAVYDAYLDAEIKFANGTSKYLENLPEPARGISDWDGETAIVFTESNVYQYDSGKKDVVGEAESLDVFLNCYFVEIPPGEDVQR